MNVYTNTLDFIRLVFGKPRLLGNVDCNKGSMVGAQTYVLIVKTFKMHAKEETTMLSAEAGVSYQTPQADSPSKPKNTSPIADCNRQRCEKILRKKGEQRTLVLCRSGPFCQKRLTLTAPYVPRLRTSLLLRGYCAVPQMRVGKVLSTCGPPPATDFRAKVYDVQDSSSIGSYAEGIRTTAYLAN